MPDLGAKLVRSARSWTRKTVERRNGSIESWNMCDTVARLETKESKKSNSANGGLLFIEMAGFDFSVCSLLSRCLPGFYRVFFFSSNLRIGNRTPFTRLVFLWECVCVCVDWGDWYRDLENHNWIMELFLSLSLSLSFCCLRLCGVQVFQWKQLENLYFRDRKFSIEVHDPAKR